MKPIIPLPKLFKFNHKVKKAGLPPGTIVPFEERREKPVKITAIEYDQASYEIHTVNTAKECVPFVKTERIIWINMDGIHDVPAIEQFGEMFSLHNLVLEDIAATSQRPKMEDYRDKIFFILNMLYFDQSNEHIVSEQVSFVLGPNFVLSFQEQEGDVFNPVRNRIIEAQGKVRNSGADYLMYCLMDAIVDNYYVILEKVGTDLEKVEMTLQGNPQPDTLRMIYKLKRDILMLRRSIWPLREVVNKFEKIESPLFQDKTKIYLRDVYDHTIQIIDAIEVYRDMLAAMQDIYLSTVNNKMNSVMQILTIIATIMMPLTFIAGIYGMNFSYMPELQWRYSYFVVLGVMFAIALAMVLWFKRKNWF